MDGRVMYAGIDEAGYGPMLGPLCVAMTVFEAPVSDFHADLKLPSLWKALSPVVCRDVSKTTTSRIAVNDSKQLKGSNSLKTKHPLAHLERGVLGFLQSMGDDVTPPEADSVLLEALGALAEETASGPPEWYSGDGVELPVSTTLDHIRFLGGRLRARCTRAEVRLLDVAVRTLDERAFNEHLSGVASKAEVTLAIVGRLIRRVWRSQRSVIRRGEAPGVVIVDRQSGRMRYAETLRNLAPEATIRVLREDSRESLYELSAAHDPESKRCIRVCFCVEAEQAHMPVALASMTAKYIRELAMMRFNRFWCGRYSELKPTAGYFTDARRWLDELRMLSGMSEAAIRELCRRA